MDIIIESLKQFQIVEDYIFVYCLCVEAVMPRPILIDLCGLEEIGLVV